MIPANSLLPILHRLDEIERKLDHMMEELRALAPIGYSVQERTERSAYLAPALNGWGIFRVLSYALIHGWYQGKAA
jgi:hypothetical protein